MAFLIGAAVRTGVNAVRSGVQAHQDFKHEGGPTVHTDRYGLPKSPGPMYGLVMKAETKIAAHKDKGKAKDGAVEVPAGHGEVAIENEAVLEQAHAEREERHADTKANSFGGEDYGPQEYHGKALEANEAPPPSYDSVVSAGMQGHPAEAKAADGSYPRSTSGYAAGPPTAPPSGMAGPSEVIAPHRHRRDSSSSDSDSSHDEAYAPGQASMQFPSRRALKAERRARRAERRALRARMRADRALGF